MILEKEPEVVESSGFSSTKTAEIKATPAMLRMLSSGIYSDKISAFIRELSTNAYDAMVEAGTIKDKTFIVHLPTKLEPWFNIRDYGTGLSKDGMENNFSNFGDGTKAESNVYNGAFGLGSKSPLSYTRDFTIISYYEGKKTFYNYGLNDENIPVLSTAFSQPSDEHSGLEIQIAINNSDIEEVQRKAELIYRYFDKRPETNIEIDYHELPRLVEGDGWFLTSPDVRKYSSGGGYNVHTPTRVIMGNVIYPINSNGLASTSPIYPMTSTPFVIKVQIGDVQMTPSRESLEMTPKTIKFLEDKFKEIIKELSSNLESKIDKTLCVFDKVLSSFELLKLMPDGIKTCKIDKFTVSTNRWTDVFTFPRTFHSMCKLKRLSKDSTYYYKKTEEYGAVTWRPQDDLNYIFLIVDSSKRVGAILDEAKRTYNHVYVVRPVVPISSKSTTDLDVFNKEVKKFLESCGNPKCIYASLEEAKLPPIVRAKPQPKVAGYIPTPKVKSSIKVRQVVCEPTYFNTTREITITGDDTNDCYFLYSYRNEIKGTDGKTVYNLRYCLQKMIQDLEAKLNKKINVVQVSGTSISRVRKDSRFIDLLGEIKKHNFVIEVSQDHSIISGLLKDFWLDSKVLQKLEELKYTKLPELFSMRNSTQYNQTTNHKAVFTQHNYVFVDAKPIDLTKYKKELEDYHDLQYLNYRTTKDVIKEFYDMINERKFKSKKD